MANNYFFPVDNSLRIMGEIFPTERAATKFDKMLELIKALSSNSIPGVIGQALDTTGKVFSSFISGKQRIQAVEYVKDAYEVKCRSEVELERIKSENQRNQLITLYIEKSFQAQMDEINKNIILQSKQLELEHRREMNVIDSQHKQAILNMNLVAKEHLHNIDKKYAEMIRRNENYCLLYRQYLMALQESNVTPGVLIKEVSSEYMQMLNNFVSNPNVSTQTIKIAVDGALKLLDFIKTTGDYFIPFEEFIYQKRKIEDWNDEKL